MGHYDKDKAAAKRAAWIAAGLTSKGKERKGRHKPDPHQSIKFSKKRKPPAPPKPRAKRETPEQRRERGRQLSASPMALAIEERVKKRLEAA